jgi:hypothetical protein
MNDLMCRISGMFYLIGLDIIFISFHWFRDPICISFDWFGDYTYNSTLWFS